MAGALAVWIPGGSENSGRPSMVLKIENFTDDFLNRPDSGRHSGYCCAPGGLAQRPGIDSVIGQLEAAGVAQHVGVRLDTITASKSSRSPRRNSWRSTRAFPRQDR